MTTSTQDLDKRLAQLKQEVPKRGYERHPSIINTLADLPAELQSPAVLALASNETLQTIIAFPPQIHRGHHYVPKQALLFTPTAVIHILASIWPDQEPQLTFLKGNDFLYMKVTLLLLYGFLEIVGPGQNSPTRLGMEFNTVAWDKLDLPLRRLLQTTKSHPASLEDKTTYSASAASACEKLPMKFSNGVKIHGLLPGEELEDMVFQPGITERLLFLFNRSVLANTLLMLTSNFVTVIQEELKVAQGWIVSYIPRNNIVGIHSQPFSQWNELTLRLKRSDQTADYKLKLNEAATQAWRLLWIQHGGKWEDIAGQAGE